MNRIIRNLVITIPLATVGLTMVNVTAATAGPNGPDVIVIKPKGGDPLPPKPPKNLDLTPAQIVAHAQAINQQAVQSKAMPIGNLTQMTEEERGMLGGWIAAGAPAK